MASPVASVRQLGVTAYVQGNTHWHYAAAVAFRDASGVQQQSIRQAFSPEFWSPATSMFAKGDWIFASFPDGAAIGVWDGTRLVVVNHVAWEAPSPPKEQTNE